MILLYLYRIVVFTVSAVSHYAALVALLWFGQVYGRSEGFLTGDYIYTLGDLAVLSAMLQGVVFLLIISPFGGLFQAGCMPVRRMSKREAEVLGPMLNDVMQGYKDKKPSCIKRIRLRIEDNTQSNAYAFGKNTIVLTSGFFREYRWRAQLIKGVIAHELGHLHHRDLWFCHYVAGAGGVFTLIYAAFTLASFLAIRVADIFLPFLIVALPVMMLQLAMSAVIYIVRLPETVLGALSVFLSRAQEYRADNLVAVIIGVKGMIEFLESVQRGECYTEVGFLTMKRRSHPPSELRLEKLYDHLGYQDLAAERRINLVMERAIKRKIGVKKAFSKGISRNYSGEENLTSYI